VSFSRLSVGDESTVPVDDREAPRVSKPRGAWTSRPLCGATTRRGGQCQRPAGEGTDHLGFGTCRLHGGSTITHRQAAVAEMARAHVASLAQPVPVDAYELVEHALGWTHATILWLNTKIVELQEQDAMGPVVSTLTRPLVLGKRGESATKTVTEVREAAPDLHIWIRTRDQALDRAVRYAKVLADMGVDERRVRVQEAQADRVANVLNTVMHELVDAGLSPELLRLAGERFRHHLAPGTVAGTAIEVAS
jgi:hypothetical protein